MKVQRGENVEHEGKFKTVQNARVCLCVCVCMPRVAD